MTDPKIFVMFLQSMAQGVSIHSSFPRLLQCLLEENYEELSLEEVVELFLWLRALIWLEEGRL
jgi:hypothetical protein